MLFGHETRKDFWTAIKIVGIVVIIAAIVSGIGSLFDISGDAKKEKAPIETAATGGLGGSLGFVKMTKNEIDKNKDIKNNDWGEFGTKYHVAEIPKAYGLRDGVIISDIIVDGSIVKFTVSNPTETKQRMIGIQLRITFGEDKFGPNILTSFGNIDISPKSKVEFSTQDQMEFLGKKYLNEKALYIEFDIS